MNWIKIKTKLKTELKDLVNSQSVPVAKNEEVYLEENTEGVAEWLIKRLARVWNVDLISHFNKDPGNTDLIVPV